MHKTKTHDRALLDVCERVFSDLVTAAGYQEIHSGMEVHLRVRTLAQVAPTYFALTQLAFLQMSCLLVVRVYEPKADRASLKYLLALAEQRAGEFECGAPQARKEIEKARKCLVAAEPALPAVREMRHELVAHLHKGKIHLHPPEELRGISKQITRLVDSGCEAVNIIFAGYKDLHIVPRLADLTDYDNLMYVVREGKTAQIKAYEAEFGYWPEVWMKKELGM